MRTNRIFLALLLLPAWTGAQACLFATSTTPEGWHLWATRLFGGDVTALEKEVVTVQVIETFKGQDVERGVLTLRISERYWSNCKVERPAVGARVLVAMNANSEVMLIP